MQENRIRIVDIAERLGLSTATVSNVIHGKTSKMSPRTAHRGIPDLGRPERRRQAGIRQEVYS